jgi:hypothetical protein
MLSAAGYLRKVLWEADQTDEVLGVADIQVAAVVAVHGTSVPGGYLQADGVTIVPARRVPGLLQALPPSLGPSGLPGWPTEPGYGSAPPPDSLHGEAPEARLLLARLPMGGCRCA